jgi:predicted lipoprotein with Yx(FWY)xxD motif
MRKDVMTPMRQGHGAAKRGWRVLAAGASVVMVGGLLISSTASAQVTAKKSKTATVVNETVRGSFGEILTTTSGLTLYIQTSGTCTGSCLTIWPPLLMPKHKTKPLGVSSGLGTAKLKSRRQVTYEGKRLYTFYTDSGTSTNGEGEGGFVVAQVSTPAT